MNTHFEASTTDSFWKHCGKRRNCSYRAISPFPTMFSPQSDNCTPFDYISNIICLFTVNWKSPYLAYEVKGSTSRLNIDKNSTKAHLQYVFPWLNINSLNQLSFVLKMQIFNLELILLKKSDKRKNIQMVKTQIFPVQSIFAGKNTCRSRSGRMFCAF